MSEFNSNKIVIITLTSFLAGFAEGWSLLLCAMVGVLIAVATHLKFIYFNFVSSAVMLISALVIQYVLQVLSGLDFYGERIAFMVSPLMFMFAIKFILNSNLKIKTGHRIRLWLLKYR